MLFTYGHILSILWRKILVYQLPYLNLNEIYVMLIKRQWIANKNIKKEMIKLKKPTINPFTYKFDS